MSGSNTHTAAHMTLSCEVGQLSVEGGVKVHGFEESRPEELLTSVWVALVTRIVEVVDVLQESRDLTVFI